MLRWTSLLLVAAVLVRSLGISDPVGAVPEIARNLSLTFLVLIVGAMIFSAFRGKPPV